MKKPCLEIAPGQKTWRDYGRPSLGDVPDSLRLPAPSLIPAAASKQEALDVLAETIGLTLEHPTRVIKTPVEMVAVQLDLLGHIVEKRVDAREQYSQYLLPTLMDPYEVWLTEYENGLRTRYIGIFQDMRDFLVVVRVNKDGSLFWNLVRSNQKYLNQQRVGTLMFGK
ncbi:MAG: hypothetical protein HQL66_00685 [Magnetococcales bacterium]|nr:hypothetical protein [Magnetococcales bacterium]